MPSARDRVLDAAVELVAAGDIAPALEVVAAAAGVSKGGLLYHFPDKKALFAGIINRAVAEVDAAFTAAAAQGRLAEKWLRLSAPGDGDQHLFQSLLSMLRLTSSGDMAPPEEVLAAGERWQRMLDEELGHPADARLVRLVGDGLLLNALTGQPAPTPAVDELVRQLTSRSACPSQE